MRPLTIFLAAGAVLTSSSAFAGKTTAQNKPQAAANAVAADSSSDRKYCLSQEPDDNATGTRLYNHECKTKAQWAKQGVDIDELKKAQ